MKPTTQSRALSRAAVLLGGTKELLVGDTAARNLLTLPRRGTRQQGGE